MLEAGEDPLYVARRLVRMAIEDIGLADPQALPLAMAAQQAVHFLGMPEGTLALAECAVYLAAGAQEQRRLHAPTARCSRTWPTTRNDPVPLHLRNAPTRADERPRLRQGLQVRPRLRERRGRPGAPARIAARAASTTSRPTAAASASSPPAWPRAARSRSAPPSRRPAPTRPARPRLRLLPPA